MSMPGLKCLLFATLLAFSLSLSVKADEPAPPAENKPAEASTDESKPSPAPEVKVSPEEALQKARAEVSRKHYPDAKLILKQAIASNPINIALQAELYETCVKTKDWSDASAALQKVMEIDPSKEKDYYAAYGKTLFELHRYDKAKAALTKAIGFGKDKDEIYKTLLQIGIREKDEPAIDTAYREYLKVKPNDGDMHWEYANFLYKNGKGVKESLPQYKLASDNRPNYSPGHERYAYLLMCNKEWGPSIDAYIKAIHVAPQNEVGRLNQALKYVRQQQKAAAGPAPAPAADPGKK